MWLTIDIGNSAVKGAFFLDSEILGAWKLARPGLEDVRNWQERFFAEISRHRVTRAGVASVVPSLTRVVRDQIHSCVPLLEISPELLLPFSISYTTTKTLGPDRLAAAAAAWQGWGRSRAVIVVDIGTAINIEVVSSKGVYLGGIIGAGPETLRNSLSSGTALLPAIDLVMPSSPVGNSTQEALQAGIMFGVVDQIRGALRRIRHQIAEPCVVVGTGGWGSALMEHLDVIEHFDPYLTQRGIRILMALNPTRPT